MYTTTDITGKIIAFENGELVDDHVIELFQELVNSGLAWKLQGSYGRFAARLLAGGLITEGPVFWEGRA